MGLNILISYFFLRLVANQFGVTEEKAAFDIAYSVPFLVVSVTGFVFLHGALVKHFSELLIKSPEKVSADFNSISFVFMFAGCVSALLVYLFRFDLAYILAPGFSEQTSLFLSELIVYLLPLVISTSLFIYLSALLTAYKIPLAAETCSMISRVFIVLAFYFFQFEQDLKSISVYLSISSFVALIPALYLVFKHTDYKFLTKINLRSDGIGLFFKQAFAFILTGILAQISFAVMRGLASLEVLKDTGDSWLAALAYALSIIGPLSLIIGKPLALSFGPEYIKELFSSSSREAFSQLKKVFISSTLVTILASILIFYFSKDIITFLFQTGEFNAQAIELTSYILRWLVFSLPALVLMWLMLFPLLALSNNLGAPIVYGAGYLSHIVFSFLFFKMFDVDGLLLAYLLMNYLQVFVAIYLMYRVWNLDK